ncbi:MAG: twin-arginine translocase TatA/TatE family subunit [Gemmatimonadetes bacterium]|nr:twin-arginine translocase TatA/TatE family subunit [Gemmatimonadota bacterium]
MPFGGLGMWEVLLILLVLLLVFGARRLPELGSSLGKGIREFKRSVKDIEGELSRPLDENNREVRSASKPAAVPPASEKPAASEGGQQ